VVRRALRASPTKQSRKQRPYRSSTRNNDQQITKTTQNNKQTKHNTTDDTTHINTTNKPRKKTRPGETNTKQYPSKNKHGRNITRAKTKSGEHKNGRTRPRGEQHPGQTRKGRTTRAKQTFPVRLASSVLAANPLPASLGSAASTLAPGHLHSVHQPPSDYSSPLVPMSEACGPFYTYKMVAHG
jgi:hypothetical protein